MLDQRYCRLLFLLFLFYISIFYQNKLFTSFYVYFQVKQWLQTEALIQNPKIEVTDGRFVFKPMYKIKDKKSLLRLLKQHDLKGLGGILLEDIQESLPHCDKHLKVSMNI